MQPPAADEVRAQLKRILESQPFAGTPRLRTFLRYVVDRTLDGEGGQLKEYAIGTDVFERDAQYDPRIDSIVRVEAGRLRAKVEEYYRGEGAGDRVMVRIPRGSYVPLFEMREAVAPVTAAGRRHAGFRVRWRIAALLLATVATLGIAFWRPAAPILVDRSTDSRVAVLPFAHYASGGTDERLAARITDGVTTELARINAAGVVSRTSALQFGDGRKPLREVAQLLNATELVEGSVTTDGDTVRVTTRIVNGRTDLKTSVLEFEGRRDLVDDLTRRIAAALSASLQRRQAK
jgi:TolB-like protein